METHGNWNFDKMTGGGAAHVPTWAKFWDLAADKEAYRALQRSSLAERDGVLEILDRMGTPKFLSVDGHTCVCLYVTEDEAIVLVYNHELYWEVAIAGPMSAAIRLETIFETAIPPIVSDATKIPVVFWTLGQSGPVCRSRMMETPTWADIRKNYAANTQFAMMQLLRLREPWVGGKLVLFHGLPGTGKTFAIRALGQEWRHWCRVAYIVDPEQFFEKAEYMMHVLLEEPESKAKWNLIVMEDVDEFLTYDAKKRSGQAISRLLNLTEGFVGQGLNIMVLMTTNEPVDDLHDAVTRNGRCAAQIEFPKLSVAEAKGWALDHKVPVPQEAMTLADMFARQDGRTIRGETKRERVGFAASGGLG